MCYDSKVRTDFKFKGDEDMFELKDVRENKLKLTQAEFAELIGIRQDAVSRLEADPSKIQVDMIIKIAQVTGTTIDELLNYKRPEPNALQIDDVWRNVDFVKKTIVNYIDEKSKIYQDRWGSDYNKYIQEIQSSVDNAIVKPKIAIVGNSDVGKSRLINSIIGSEKMPTGWTPTTAITVYIKHVQDRPSFIADEAVIFKASVDNVVGWEEKNLNNMEYFTKWKLASGNAAILKDYGTRQGEQFGKNEAGAAVIFVESELLKVCDVLDLPGFGTGDRIEDDLMTLNAKSVADILIYMSHSGQFLQGSGLEYLKENINGLNVIENEQSNKFGPLSNLFIIASQAHTIESGNLTSLNTILDSGCSRLFKTLPAGYFMYKSGLSGYKYDFDAVRSRFFTYTTDIERLRKPFEKELKALVEALPSLIVQKAMEFIRDFTKNKGIDLDNAIEEYKNIIAERDRYVLLLAEIKKHEPIRANQNKNRRQDLVLEIKKMKESSIADFSKEYESFMTVDNIVEIIKEKGFSKKKEDVQLLVSYINSSLQGGLQRILQSQSEQLRVKIDEYVADFESSIKNDKIIAAFPGFNFNFDAKVAFASGLAGLAAFGGLALWASTLGNLGAYILVAKGVSLLSAIGISVGGTGAAAAAVAAIGGPVVLGVVLAVLAAIAIFSIFSGGWEKSLAKKIIKEYDKNNCETKFKKAIEDFWSDTETAFNASADMLDAEWANYVKNLEKIVLNYNVTEIEAKIKAAEDFKNFLLGIPLLNDGLKTL